MAPRGLRGPKSCNTSLCDSAVPDLAAQTLTLTSLLHVTTQGQAKFLSNFRNQRFELRSLALGLTTIKIPVWYASGDAFPMTA